MECRQVTIGGRPISDAPFWAVRSRAACVMVYSVPCACAVRRERSR
jgi:hypothetical protein